MNYLGPIIVLTILPGISLASPFLINKYGSSYLSQSRLKLNLFILSSFSAGSFLSLALIHTLPNSIKNLEKLAFRINGMNFSFAYTIPLLGIILMLILELSLVYFGAPLREETPSITQFKTELADPLLTESGEKNADSQNEESNSIDNILDRIELEKKFIAVSSVVILVFISLFDGLSTVYTQPKYLWRTTIITVIFEIIVAISLAVNLYLSTLSKTQVNILGSLFIVSIPLRILLFTILPTATIFTGIMGGVTTGCLIFVSFKITSSNLEIQSRSLIHVYQFISFFTACILIFLISFLEFALKV